MDFLNKAIRSLSKLVGEVNMNQKTILKFNSNSSIRPAAWLALAVLAVGAFGNSVQAQAVWLNETLSGYSADGGSLNTTTSPNLISAGGSYTVSVAGSVKKLRAYKPAGATTPFTSTATSSSSRIAYKLSTDASNATDRPVGYLSFKVTPNPGMVNVFSANAADTSILEAGLGPTGLDVPQSSGNLFFWARMYYNISSVTPQFKVKFYQNSAVITTASAISSTASTLNSSTENTIKIWYNKGATGVSYNPPSGGSSVTLAANSWVAYVNDVLAPGFASTGTAFLNTQANSIGTTTPVSTVGKFAAYNGASGHTYDFSLSDIYVADSAPVVAAAAAITSATTGTAQAGYPFSYTIASSGVTSPVYSTSTLPAGLSLNTSTGVISGTISTTATQGLSNITLTATGTGGPATGNLALTINPPPPAAPVITSAATATGKLTQAFSYQITTGTTSPSSTPTSYAIVTGTLPSGLALNTSTGAITGTPNGTAGVTVVTYTATNPTGTSAEQTLTITLDAAPLYAWNNTGTVWTSASSWTNGVAPANSASTDTAVFGNLGGSATSVNVGTGQSIGGIVFNSGAYAYTWTGTDITVGGLGGITNNAAAIQTFNNKVINSSANTTWSSVSGGSLVFNGGVELTQASSTANRILTIAGAGNVTVSGAIANGGTATAGVVAVTGTGTTIFSGNNTYSGLTTMNAAGGTLTLSGNNSGAAGGVTLTAGTLNINNNNALGTGPISFATTTTMNNTSGSAVVNAGNQAWTWTDLLTFGSSTNTAANNLNLGTGVVTASSSRTITLAGTGAKLTMGPVNITSASSGRTLTANGAGNTLEMGGLTLSANLTVPVVVDLLGSANLNVTGPIVNGTAFAHGVNVGATGTNTFSGANTYTGTTKVSGNTLILSGTSASSGYILAGTSSPVVLKVNAIDALNSAATLLGSSSSSTVGTLEFAAAGDYTLNQYLGQNMGFSNSSGSSATLTFTNAINTLGTTASGKTFANKSTNLTITFKGEVDLSGTITATNTITAIGPVVISNRVFSTNTDTTTTRSLLKDETGTLTMCGANSYNGTTMVSRGILSIPAGGSLANCGATIVSSTSASAVNSASLNLAGSAGVVQVSTNGFVRGGGSITTLQVQAAGTVEVPVGSTWTTGGTIDFATGSKVSVTGTPVAGTTYTLMTASSDITGSTPTLVGAAGWGLRVTGSSLYLEEAGVLDIASGATTTYSTANLFTGASSLLKRGAGTAVIDASNDFTGGTVVEAGTLQVQNANGLGTGAVTLKAGTLKSTVDLDLAKLVSTTSTVGASTLGYTDTYGLIADYVKYTGNTTTLSGPVTLDVATETTMTMLTLVGNSDANSLVTKIGAGTVKLMGGSTTGTANVNSSTVMGGWRIEQGTVWFTPSSNNGGGTGPITLAGGTAKFSKLQNSNGTFTGYEVPSDLTVESNGLIQYDPSPLTLLGQNNLGFKNLSIGAKALEVATATTSTVQGQALPSVNFKSATLTGTATLKNPANLDLNLQAVSGAGGFTKTGLGTLYLSDQPNQAAAFAKLTSGMTVESINVEYAGNGYAAAPAVTLEGGGAITQATATANIDGNGRVTSITVNTTGSGYTSLPRVVIAAPATIRTANSYTGATIVQEGKLNLNGTYASSLTVKSGAALQLDWLAPAQARCSIDAISSGTTGYLANAANAYVKDLYLTKSVAGYTPGATLNLTIAAPSKTDGTGLVPGGVAATATATVNSDGVISALNIVNGGSGYVIAPMVTIPAPTVPTVVARTTGSIAFESGAKLSLNINPTSTSYTLLTADGGITGNPVLEPSISGYALTKSSDGKSLILDQLDTTKPVITLIGSSTVNVDYGASYADLGATVDDNKDATRSINGVGSVNTLVPGSYTISFNTTDAAGNAADTVTRTVVVGPAPVTDGYAVYLSSNGLPAGTAFNAKVNGVTAGLVYAFGASNGSPRNNGVTAVPVMSGNQLTYTFDVKDDSVLTVTYQTSSDLVNWTAAQAVSAATGASPAGFVKKQVQVSGSGKLFVRINVTHP